jgi:hypothetical protein
LNLEGGERKTLMRHRLAGLPPGEGSPAAASQLSSWATIIRFIVATQTFSAASAAGSGGAFRTSLPVKGLRNGVRASRSAWKRTPRVQATIQPRGYQRMRAAWMCDFATSMANGTSWGVAE